MIVDSSAVLAIVFREPEWERLVQAMLEASAVGIGAPTLAETGVVLGTRIGFEKRGLLFRLLEEFSITRIPFSDTHWAVAVEAYERYGKGRHKAGLNFGDCLTYAMARVSGQPLLFVGQDFAQTDVEAAPY